MSRVDATQLDLTDSSPAQLNSISLVHVAVHVHTTLVTSHRHLSSLPVSLVTNLFLIIHAFNCRDRSWALH